MQEPGQKNHLPDESRNFLNALNILNFRICSNTKVANKNKVMQEASDALSKTADSDTVSTYQVSSVQLVTDKKLEAFNKA